MKTLGQSFFMTVCFAGSVAVHDIPSTTHHPSSQEVVFGDLGKYLFDKVIEQETVIQKLLSDVTFLTEKQNSYKQKINALNQRVTSLQNENKLIKGQYTSLKADFSLMNTTCSCSGMQQSYSNITDVEGLKKQFRYLSLSLADLHTKAKKMNQTIVNIINVKIKNVDDSLHSEIQNISESCQKSVTDIVNKTEILDSDIKMLSVPFKQIQAEQVKLSSSIARMEQHQSNVSKKIEESLNKTATDFRKSLLRYVHEQENLFHALAGVRKELEDFKKLSRNENKSKISFTVGIKGSKGVSNGHALIFDKVITNIGGGYSTYNGMFTAPTEGTFVFYCSIYTYRGMLRTDIVSNGNTVAQMYAYDTNTGEESSGLVVLQLKQGDRVWIRHYSGNNYYTEYPHGIWTAFSGFML